MAKELTSSEDRSDEWNLEMIRMIIAESNGVLRTALGAATDEQAAFRFHAILKERGWTIEATTRH